MVQQATVAATPRHTINHRQERRSSTTLELSFMSSSLGMLFTVGATLGASVASAFTTVSGSVKGLQSKLDRLQAVSLHSGALIDADSKLKSIQSKLSAGPYLPVTEAALTKQLDAARLSFEQAQRAANGYGVTVGNMDKKHKSAGAAIRRTEAALERQQKKLANQSARQEYTKSLAGSLGAAIAVGVPIKLAIDYESNWAELQKRIQFASTEDEQQLKQCIFSVSERSGLGTGELTKLTASAAPTDIVKNADGTLDPEKAIQFLSDAAELSVTCGISAEEAGKRLAAYRSDMGLTAEQARGMGDSMSYLAAQMGITAADTSSVAARIGAAGKTAGLSGKSIAGLSAALAATSGNKEASGAAMNSFLETLSQGDAMPARQKALMERLGFGNTAALAEGMRQGGKTAEDTLLTVFSAIRELPVNEQKDALNGLFGNAAGSINPLISKLDMLQKAFALANAEEAAGAQLKAFELQSTTTESTLNRLTTAGQNLGTVLGSAVLPILQPIASATAGMIDGIRILAGEYPVVTTGTTGFITGLVVLRATALAGGYAATILSDGWQIAKGIFAALRPSVIAATVAQKAHAAVALASAAKTRGFTAALVVQKGVSAALAGGTALLTGAVRLLGLAFASNPIGFIIMSVITLGTAVYALSSKWEPLRIAVDKCTAWIGEKLQWVSGLFTPVLDKLKTVAQWMGIVDNGVEFHDESGVADDGYAAYPGMSDLPKRETSFWDDWFGSKTEPTQAAVQPPTIAEPFAGPTKPALSEAAAKPAQAKLSGQARTAPASSRIPEYAASGEARRTPPAGNTASPSARQPVSLNFSMPVTLNGIPAADMGDALLRSIDSRASAIEERIARMLGNIVGDQRRLAYGN